MRVSHVITRLIVGGAQENTVSTVLGLLDRGIETELISGPTGGAEGSLEGEFAGRPGALIFQESLVRPIAPWQDLKATFELTRRYRRTRPEIVHTHSGKAGFVGRLAAKRAGVGCIIHTIHGPSFGPFQSKRENFIYTAAEKYVGRFTTHFISVAQAMTDQYLAAGIGKPEKYTRIFSGFVLEPFLAVKPDLEMRARLGFAPGDFVITKLARLFELKGHDDLFDAAPRIVELIPNAKFLLIGDGPWRERFEERARHPALKGRVVFAGLVAPLEVPKYLAAADVVAHLSYREGLPRALSQALASALPVVAYDCDGANEVCLDGRTGFLIAKKDLGALADRLARLAKDAELRRKFGETGRTFVRENFGVDKMVDDILALYRRLLRRRA
jgi:glycosyltransferase involved in cell wall biosynthesis